MRTTLRSIARRYRIALGVTVGAATVAALCVAAWPTHSATPAPYTPPVRARVYTDYTACLLTGPSGIADARAAQVWSGMEAASSTTRDQVSYLQLQGPQTAGSADAYINTLALRGCSLILTIGQIPGQGAADRAKDLPRDHFITVAGPTSTAANITAVAATSPTDVTASVKTLMIKDLAAAGTTTATTTP